jgi:DUF1365 family protein
MKKDDIKYFNKELPVKLTQTEMLDKAKELSRANQDIVSLESSMKSMASEFKSKIQGKEAEIDILSQAISNGYEYRPVECYWDYDWKGGKKHLVRTDTGESVRVEDISQSERQGRLEDAEVA